MRRGAGFFAAWGFVRDTLVAAGLVARDALRGSLLMALATRVAIDDLPTALATVRGIALPEADLLETDLLETDLLAGARLATTLSAPTGLLTAFGPGAIATGCFDSGLAAGRAVGGLGGADRVRGTWPTAADVVAITLGTDCAGTVNADTGRAGAGRAGAVDETTGRAFILATGLAVGRMAGRAVGLNGERDDVTRVGVGKGRTLLLGGGFVAGTGRCRLDRCGFAFTLGRYKMMILPISAINAAPHVALMSAAMAARAVRSLFVLRTLISS